MTRYPIEEFREGKNGLSRPLTRLHGCDHCDWRHSERCPVFMQKIDDFPASGICDGRLEYLREIANMIPSEVGKVTIDIWLRYVTMVLGQQDLMNLKSRRDGVFDRLKEAEERGDANEIRVWTARYDMAHGQYERFFKQLINLHEQGVARNTPKKHIHAEVKLRPEDAVNIIEGRNVKDIKTED